MAHTNGETFDYSNGSKNTYLVEERHQLIPKCYACGKTSKILLDGSKYYQYFMQDGYIQQVFSDLTAPQREHIMSGIHPDCWEAMFKDEE